MTDSIPTAPTPKPLPPANDLSFGQHQGWRCVWCSGSLLHDHGAVSMGHARGWIGTHGYTIEVYSCSTCAQSPGASR